MKLKTAILMSSPIVLAIAFRIVQKPKDSGLGLKTESVSLSKFESKTQCIGRPQYPGERFMSIQRGGRLEELLAQNGQDVSEGQIIAVIEKTANSASLKAALSSYRLAQKDYSRVSRLGQSGSASREEVDRALSNLEVKRADLEKAKQSVEDGIVRAPISGKLSYVAFRKGDRLPDGARVAAVVPQDQIVIICRMPNEVVSKLQNESKIDWRILGATSEASQQSIVKFQKAQEASAFVGMDQEVSIESTDVALKTAVGQNIEITVTLGSENAAARIPSIAVVKRADGDYVYIQDKEMKIHRQKVVSLQRDANQAVVTGLSEGQSVIILDRDASQLESIIAKNEKESKGG
jgi:membrane fusion protein (multidrug efflux system)